MNKWTTRELRTLRLRRTINLNGLNLQTIYFVALLRSSAHKSMDSVGFWPYKASIKTSGCRNK